MFIGVDLGVEVRNRKTSYASEMLNWVSLSIPKVSTDLDAPLVSVFQCCY